MTLLEPIALVFALLVALSIVWSTLQTGISPTMSSGKACKAMLESVETTNSGRLIDLGSGWGTLVIALARKYPDKKVIGYELSWFPWLVSVIRKHSLGLDNLTLYREDFRNAEFGNASVLFCYLFPGGMSNLHEKLNRERFNEILIVSNTFALPSCQPTKVIRLNDFYRSPVYVYHWQPMGVSEYLGQTKGTVSQTLKVLENHGLLTKVPDAEDRRVTHLRLTDGGREILARARPAPVL